MSNDRKDLSQNDKPIDRETSLNHDNPHKKDEVSPDYTFKGYSENKATAELTDSERAEVGKGEGIDNTVEAFTDKYEDNDEDNNREDTKEADKE